MKRHYGEALYAIPVDLSFGCPNRTKDGMGGCTFCPEHGARAAQIADAKSVEEQVSRAISFASRRYGAKSFALYIQAYTATFATLEKQKKRVNKYGSWLALLTWIPIIGDVFALALGFYRTNFYSSAFFMLIGKLVRFVLIIIVFVYFKVELDWFV